MSGTEKILSSDDMVDIGEEHHKARRLQEAEAYYRNALELDPGHPGALYYLANIAYDDGRLSLATQLMDKLLRDEPNDAEAWHLLGMIALKEKVFSKAVECINKALAIQSTFIQAHHSLGNALSGQGDNAAAALSYERAIALNPNFFEAYISRGSVLTNLKRYDEALICYEQAIALNPSFAMAHISRGSALKDLGRLDEALVCFDKAIALEPNLAVAHNGRGIALILRSRVDEAVACFRQAIALNPQDASSFENLGKALYSLGEIDKAAAIYRQWLAQEPNNPIARHYLAACTSEAVPARAEDAYVEHTFDEFAENFDKVLGQLEYRAPQILAEVLQRECGTARKQFVVLDAGCGTGLCGPLLTDYCAKLIGVDLSEGMLAKAKERNVYDELIKAELTAYLQAQNDVFNIILSADTLVYFGALEEVLAAARAAMCAGGHLLFTVEAIAGDDASNYLINTNGRYRHSEAYLRRTLSDAGFMAVTIEAAIMRYEGGSPVRGFAVCCRVA